MKTEKQVSVCLLIWMLSLAVVQAATFNTGTNWYETAGKPFYGNDPKEGTVRLYSRDFRVWIPDTPGIEVKGAIFFWPGDGNDYRTRVTQTNFQDVARSLDFALIGMNNGWHPSSTFPAETGGGLLRILQAAAQASGHPELAASPHMHTGFSRGAYSSADCGQAASERIIAYAPIRGGGTPYPPYLAMIPETLQKVPGIFLPGSTDVQDSGTRCSYVENTFGTLRTNTYPVAFGVDRGIWHTPDAGQSWEMGMYYMAETCRKRVELAGGWPAPTNGFVVLPNLPLESGWLGQSEDFSTNSYNNTSIRSYPFPYIASYGSYTDAVANASWMPSEGAAIAYRAFAATDGTVYSQVNSGFRNGPLYITNVGAFANCYNGSNLVVSVNPRTFDDTRTILEMDLYLDSTVIATDTSAADGWGFSVTVTNAARGVHALTVVAEADSGEKTSCFRTIVIQNNP
jgi:hypothetical protein